MILTRVVPDTDLAIYPANDFAGYRISGLIVHTEFFLEKNYNFLIFNNTYQHFWSLFHSYFILL